MLGLEVGLRVGDADGEADGALDGLEVGFRVGDADGEAEGALDGLPLGLKVGVNVGLEVVGAELGATEGPTCGIQSNQHAHDDASWRFNPSPSRYTAPTPITRACSSAHVCNDAWHKTPKHINTKIEDRGETSSPSERTSGLTWGWSLAPGLQHKAV